MSAAGSKRRRSATNPYYVDAQGVTRNRHSGLSLRASLAGVTDEELAVMDAERKEKQAENRARLPVKFLETELELLERTYAGTLAMVLRMHELTAARQEGELAALSNWKRSTFLPRLRTVAIPDIANDEKARVADAVEVKIASVIGANYAALMAKQQAAAVEVDEAAAAAAARAAHWRSRIAAEGPAAVYSDIALARSAWMIAGHTLNVLKFPRAEKALDEAGAFGRHPMVAVFVLTFPERVVREAVERIVLAQRTKFTLTSMLQSAFAEGAHKLVEELFRYVPIRYDGDGRASGPYTYKDKLEEFVSKNPSVADALLSEYFFAVAAETRHEFGELVKISDADVALDEAGRSGEDVRGGATKRRPRSVRRVMNRSPPRAQASRKNHSRASTSRKSSRASSRPQRRRQ